MTEFDALIAKTCSYWIYDGDKNKKAEGTKKCKNENLKPKMEKKERKKRKQF